MSSISVLLSIFLTPTHLRTRAHTHTQIFGFDMLVDADLRVYLLEASTRTRARPSVTFLRPFSVP